MLIFHRIPELYLLQQTLLAMRCPGIQPAAIFSEFGDMHLFEPVKCTVHNLEELLLVLECRTSVWVELIRNNKVY